MCRLLIQCLTAFIFTFVSYDRDEFPGTLNELQKDKEQPAEQL